MKHFNVKDLSKKYLFNHYEQYKPYVYKWSLFSLLVGSAGFSLSMNPQHFNIARHDLNKVYSVELALSAPPVAAVKRTAADPKSNCKPSGVQAVDEACRKADEAVIVDNKGVSAAKPAKPAKPVDATAAPAKPAAAAKGDETTVAQQATAVTATPVAAAEQVPAVPPLPPGEKPAEGKPADKAPEAAAPVADGKILTTQVHDANGKLYNVTIVSKNNEYKVKFNRPDLSEGATCAVCSEEPSFKADSDFDVIGKITKFIDDKIKGSTATDTDSSEERTELTAEDKARIKAQVPGKATEIDPEEWDAKAEKCDAKKDADSKMNCHSNVLLALSKYLKDDKATADIVNKYFLNHMRSDLANALKAKTIRLSRREEDCDSESVIGVTTSGNRQQCVIYNQDSLEQANNTISDLVEKLKEKNGAKTIALLSKMKAASYAVQMQNAKELAVQGQNSNNFELYRLGLNALNNLDLRSNLEEDYSNLLTSADGSAGKEQILESSFFNPVTSMLNNYDQYLRGTHSEGTQNNLPNDPLKYQIPSNMLSMMGSPTVGNGGTRISGEPGNIPALWYQSRTENWRGNNITIDLPWATGNNGISSGVQPTTFNFQPAQTQNTPGFQTQNLPAGVNQPLQPQQAQVVPTAASRNR